MANEIFNKKLFNTTSGKIRSDAFVNLGYLVTMREQNKVQNIVNNKLEIKKVNPNKQLGVNKIFSQITISTSRSNKNSNKSSSKQKPNTPTRLAFNRNKRVVISSSKIFLEIAKRQPRSR